MRKGKNERQKALLLGGGGMEGRNRRSPGTHTRGRTKAAGVQRHLLREEGGRKACGKMESKSWSSREDAWSQPCLARARQGEGGQHQGCWSSHPFLSGGKYLARGGWGLGEGPHSVQENLMHETVSALAMTTVQSPKKTKTAPPYPLES